MFKDCARLERDVFVTWKEDDVDEQDIGERKECWERKRVLSHIWVKSESDLDQISTRLLTSSNQSWYARNSNFILEINLFNYVNNEVLSQYDDEEVLHSIAFYSKNMFSAECNYKIYDKKLLIIIWAFEH